MHADVKELCKRCDRCQRTNHLLQRPRSELHPIPVTKVWNRVGIDLVGPLPETRAGNKYIITLRDYFSKWPEAAPLQSKCAEGVADFLFQVFCRHGWPKIVQSDQGREFINEVNDCLFKSTNLKHCVSTAYYPQTNGLDERFNQTLLTLLKRLLMQVRMSGISIYQQHFMLIVCQNRLLLSSVLFFSCIIEIQERQFLLKWMRKTVKLKMKQHILK